MSSTAARRDEIAAFYTASNDRLERAVARRIRLRRELIEDACANAWTIFIGRPDVTLDARGLTWLTVVAVNEARSLIKRTQGEIPVGGFQADPRGHDDEDVPPPVDTDGSPADERALELIEHSQRVTAFRNLKPREREALYLKGLGHSYREIARLTDSTYTAVNRRISEGRAALRRYDGDSDRRAM